MTKPQANIFAWDAEHSILRIIKGGKEYGFRATRNLGQL